MQDEKSFLEKEKEREGLNKHETKPFSLSELINDEDKYNKAFEEGYVAGSEDSELLKPVRKVTLLEIVIVLICACLAISAAFLYTNYRKELLKKEITESIQEHLVIDDDDDDDAYYFEDEKDEDKPSVLPFGDYTTEEITTPFIFGNSELEEKLSDMTPEEIINFLETNEEVKNILSEEEYNDLMNYLKLINSFKYFIEEKGE